MNFIISAGYKYVDIDVLACSIALRELIHLQGKKAEIHLTGPFNATIPRRFLDSTTTDINRTAPVKSNESNFILVDISDPHYLELFIEIDKVSQVYDHHSGYEEFWMKHIGKQSRIESIGACATLVWEEFKAFNFHNQISSLSANLLYTAIISNTLNFKAQITSSRDKIAAKEISSFITLPKNWAEQYYKEVQKYLCQDLGNFIQKDTKTISLSHLDFFFSQLEVYNAGFFMKKFRFHKVMDNLYSPKYWLLNLISIQEECNYLFTNSKNIEDFLKENLFAKPEINYLKTENIWLRKNILKILYENN